MKLYLFNTILGNKLLIFFKLNLIYNLIYSFKVAVYKSYIIITSFFKFYIFIIFDILIYDEVKK